MNTISQVISFARKGVNQSAIDEYNSYLDQYCLKNLAPMSFDEFTQNNVS